MMEIDSKESKNYELSAVLAPHDAPVRDLAIYDDDTIVVLETIGKMDVWQRNTSNPLEFNRRDCLHEKVHAGSLAFCVEVVPSYIHGFPDGTCISGGNDKVARIWTTHGSTVGILQPHHENVNSVTFTTEGDIVTGAWDGVVRYWRKGSLIHQFSGHQNATEVLALPSGELVSASTNGNIMIHDAKHHLIKTINQAHSRSIQKLELHPLGFLSCGNDGCFKIWSNRGESLLSIVAHQAKKMDPFVYGVAVTPSGEIITCGEDRTVRVFSSSGDVIQTITHPSAVRAIKVLSNGDIVAGCTDRSVRIFTKAPERFASNELKSQFENLVNMAMASNMEELDISSLPGEEALLEPGKKDGAIKFIRQGNKGWAYKWDEVSGEWSKFGEVLGASNKHVHDGKEYDHIIDVFVTDSISYKLAFNKDEEPNDVADRFMKKHHLPEESRQQILDYITPMIDYDALSHKRELAKKNQLSQTPCWVTGSCELYGTVKADAMRNKILQFNTELLAANNPYVFKGDDFKTFERLMISISDSSNYHVASFSDAEVQLMKRLLQWPSDKILPVLDAYRVLMLHQDAVKKLGSNLDVVQQVIEQVNQATAQNDIRTAQLVQTLALQAFTNWIGKRIKSAEERFQPPRIPADIENIVSQVLELFAAAASTDKESLLAAYIFFTHNIVHWLGRINKQDSDLYLLIASGLSEALQNPLIVGNAKHLFYTLLVITSIMFVSRQGKQTIVDAFGDQLNSIIQAHSNSTTPAIREVISDIQKLLR